MITRKLAKFIYQTSYKDIPENVIEQSKLLFLDWLGVTLAGSREKIAAILLNFLEEVDGGHSLSQATLIGKGLKTDILKASLINGAVSHALDLDDYHGPVLAHPTATLLPGILAVVEWKRLSGKELITALVMAFDVFVRLGYAAGRIHYDRGWHATSTLGHFGATAGIGKLLNLNAEQLVNAFGIAGTQAGGVRQVFGTMCKPFHAGKASMDGLLSALLAEKGFTSSKEMIEGKQGFLDIFSDGAGSEKVVANLGKTYHLREISFKPYASCGFTHSTIDLMREVRKKAKVDVNDVEEIKIEVNRGALDAAGKIEPKTGLEGKFSIYYCAALALKEGEAGIDKFTDERVKDPQMVKLMKKVKAIPVEDDDLYLGARGSVRMKDGTEYKESTVFPKGDPQNPLSYDELAEKFRSITMGVLPRNKIEKLIQKIKILEELKDIGSLLDLCSP
ncbi:MAG: MmgE/PrpD family protein [Deltaproteobacteria bacterium CG03_land_8_20_14_0_80_45_14]|nr:MAG: MmgE/PrpD family protein [Deltaproteobacteria bacterium CG03_land_8_20_14_0_80_45_14]